MHVCASVECGWRSDGDGRWRTVSEGGARPSRVVVNVPLLDGHPDVRPAAEDLAFEVFIAEFAIEGLAAAILPSRPIYVAIDHGFGDWEPLQLGKLPFYH